MEQPKIKSQQFKDCSSWVKDILDWIKQIKEKAKFDDSHSLTCDFVSAKDFLKIYLIARCIDIGDAYVYFTKNAITMDGFKSLFQSFDFFETMNFIGLFLHDDRYLIQVHGAEPLVPQEYFNQKAEKINKKLDGQGNFDAQAKDELKMLMEEYLYGLSQCIMFISDDRFGYNTDTSRTEMDIMKDILDFITGSVSMKILFIKFYYGNLPEEDRKLLQGEFNDHFEKEFKAFYGGGTNTLYEAIQAFNPESITNIKFGVGSADLLLVYLASHLEVGHSA
ncbi:hypothetical protein H4219_005981 [Mycoemilia scoparia]|uniref:Uncharacterized protein n=1 Tax=Mycoemilia scoparia TaxID=417184 RepID=A0A9W7ZV70_9FUNG|nr:hypothetical protein H4219_005981 [Mycoemilia scoparia]